MKIAPIPSLPKRLVRTLSALTLLLIASTVVGLAVGRQRIDVAGLLSDPFARTLFFQLRLPRVLLALLIGASLAVSGAALQALFRNPLADPYTLGVSGGGAFGASIAITLGWSLRILGIPFVYLTSFAGAMLTVFLVRAISRTGAMTLPGALLLSGVVVNLIAAAAVLTLQYLADPNGALRILRWMVGSLDVVGLDPVWRMFLLLAPAWVKIPPGRSA
jgi:iron complex transport system permease protein